MISLTTALNYYKMPEIFVDITILSHKLYLQPLRPHLQEQEGIVGKKTSATIVAKL